MFLVTIFTVIVIGLTITKRCSNNEKNIFLVCFQVPRKIPLKELMFIAGHVFDLKNSWCSCERGQIYDLKLHILGCKENLSQVFGP